MNLQSTILVLLGVSLFVVAAPKLGDQVATGAALLFGNQDAFVNGPKRTSYGTLGSEFVINELLTSILSNEPSYASRSFLKDDSKVQAPNKIFVFLGQDGQEFVDDVYLRNAWEASRYGLALPHVVYMDNKQVLVDDVLDRLEQVTTGMVGTHLAVVGTCSSSSDYKQISSRAALSKDEGEEGTQIVLWCPQEYSLDVLKEATESSYMVMYLSDAVSASSLPKHHRSLLQTALGADEVIDRSGRVIDYDTCDGKCFAQVRMIEVYFLFWIMIIALVAGLACTNLLEGPSKFEQASRETIQE